ncbi:hypothetical protein [Asticcacaulis machinosus]|uniref:DUF4129 domain-containing protein n=1 Tax=Asticcacaulis machinosus TaxID=2984211 RepID=A0ABT5HKC9_9CAUL|nr:hypothetical protein [Asticcacaulis machinosus]MDC7676601.1 hypothetical protein [Asticcacaulis machinosus]
MGLRLSDSQTDASVSASAAAPSNASVTQDSLTSDQARSLIDKVNGSGYIQTHFTQVKPPKTEMPQWLKDLMHWLGDVITAIGKILAPLGPIMPWLIYLLVFALAMLVLSPFVRMLIRQQIERFLPRDVMKPETMWRPTKDAAAALLHDIDALAAKGEYDEAVHLLLLRSVADLNAYRPDLVRTHYSSRDILSHPLLPADARPAFGEITRWVEMSYFAGIRVGREGFDACRQAYVDFVAIEGIG